MTVYRVRSFADGFETHESRKFKRLHWLALPIKQEGDGYTELMSGHENGCAHFGAWTAVLQLAAKCSPRGTLVRDLGGKKVPHDLGSISRITRVPIEVLREAFPRLIDMGWLESIAMGDVKDDLPEQPVEPGDDGKKPGRTVQHRRGTAQESTGQEGEDAPPTPPASPDQGEAPSERPPLSADARKQRRRLDLLVILKAHNVKLDLGDNNLFQEYVDETDGHPLGWVEHVLTIHRPRANLPSKLRIALKARASEFAAWKARTSVAAITPLPEPTP